MGRSEPTDGTLALVNGRVLTFDAVGATLARSRATAVLIERGRIAAIGDDPAIMDRLGRRGDRVDLGGKVLAPGFVDAHIHAFDCALGSLKVSCLPPDVGDLSSLKARLAARAASTPVGAWVVGEGYDDMRLTERRHPTRFDLDEAIPNHPAVVTRVCGHMCVANTRALSVAGVDRRTPNPPGGRIVRDAAGTATGLLLEEAQGLILDVVPPADDEQIAHALASTGRSLIAHGITTICEALLGAFHPREAEIWMRVLSGMWDGPNVRFLADQRLVEDGAPHDLPVIGTKLFADGSVTGRTAALSQPFEGGADTGMLIHEPRRLAKLVARSVERGLPVGIHAMGDRAIAAAVAAIELAGPPPTTSDMAAGSAGTNPVRHRIEHCSLPGPSLAAMRSLGIVPVPQPVFLYAEGEAYLAQLGSDRSAHAYPLRSMIDLGLRPALSSDAPATSTEDASDPWLGVRAAATRTTWAGSSLGAREAITVGRALACYTANGASALSLGHRTGSIEIGKDADLIVLPANPLGSDPEDLVGLRPELAFIEGREVLGALRRT
jgi:predicted amidohydrolase YtcJ